MEKQKVQLVLASGGARGLAHIGVIQALEEAGYEIVEVVGCSMGAVIGGLYAADALYKYEDWLLKQDRKDILSLLDITLSKQGFIKGEKVFERMIQLVGNPNIEELSIPFKAVATDLESGEEIIFDQGSLWQALRASVSIPGIFTPVKKEGEHPSYWVDGGVVNPLPLSQLNHQRNDCLRIAVDINAKGEKPAELAQTKGGLIEIPWPEINWPFQKKEKKSEQSIGLVDILMNSYEHMQNRVIQQELRRFPPDVLISIPRRSCGIFDFHLTEPLVAVGRKKTEEALAEKSLV